MMIRYFAETDDSNYGRLALEYLKALLRLAPVRALSVSMPGAMSRSWDAYYGLFMTSMGAPYVNVVCCHPRRWVWANRIQAPLRGGGFEPIDSTTELYTVGVRNVLLTSGPPSGAPPRHLPSALSQVAAARRYEAVVVPTATACASWIELGVSPSIVAVPVVDLDALRVAILT